MTVVPLCAFHGVRLAAAGAARVLPRQTSSLVFPCNWPPPRQRAGAILDVLALLQAVVDDAADSGHEVALSGQAQPLLAWPSELRRAVVNLVENARRYGGAASIVLTDSPARVLIDICDDGPGIPEDQLARVMEPFYRLESSRSRATGGVGMGLSIAADIAARHGGELVLSNRPEGGLRARLSLPRA